MTLLALQSLNIFLSFLMLVLIGTTVYTFIPGFVIAILLTGPILRIMGKIKQGKQEGYLVLKTKYWLNQHCHFEIPYVNRVGYWSTRRTNK